MEPTELACKLLAACYKLQGTGKYSVDAIFHMQHPALSKMNCLSVWVHPSNPMLINEMTMQHVAVPICDVRHVREIIKKLEQLRRDASASENGKGI